MVTFFLRGVLIGLLFGIPAGAVGAMTVQRTWNYAVQIIRVAYDGVEIAMKVGSGSIEMMQKAIDLIVGMLKYEKTMGKTFFEVKPNIMQMHSSFIITDPKGEILRSTGEMLKNNGYNVKVINLLEMEHSNCYNPFSYIREETDVLKLITNAWYKETDTELIVKLCI